MKSINLKFVKHILKGILDGTLDLKIVPTGKKPKEAPAARGPGRPPGRRRGRPKKVGPKRGPGRPRKTAAQKKAKLVRKGKPGRIKKNLPTARAIFLYLYDKIEGVKLTSLATHFKIKRALLKPLIQKLTAREELYNDRGTIFLKKRIRHPEHKITREKPVDPKLVLEFLAENPATPLAPIAQALGETHYQRLIQVMNRLRKNGKVVKHGKDYSLAD